MRHLGELAVREAVPAGRAGRELGGGPGRPREDVAGQGVLAALPAPVGVGAGAHDQSAGSTTYTPPLEPFTRKRGRPSRTRTRITRWRLHERCVTSRFAARFRRSPRAGWRTRRRSISTSILAAISSGDACRPCLWARSGASRAILPSSTGVLLRWAGPRGVSAPPGPFRIYAPYYTGITVGNTGENRLFIGFSRSLDFPITSHL